MAEVWLGTDLMLNRQVAVKLLKAALASDPVVAERFRREAIAVAQLSHPNIVAVYDTVEDVIDGHRRQAVVMQLINGKSLRQLLDDQRRLSPELTMHIGSCVAAALDAAHRANMVHRDVKPGNILITPDGRVLLTDFGIAKGLQDGDDLTSEHIMMGTAKYLSPEQVRGYRLDGRADLYSLGLVLYECLAGRVPFLGETDADTALARLNRDPTDLDRLRPTLPGGLAALVHRMLSRKPGERPASGAEVRNELQSISARHQPAARPTITQPPIPVTAPPNPASRPPAPPPRPIDGARPAPRRTDSSAPTPSGRSSTPSGGYQPVHGGRPAGAPIRADRTPQSTARPKQRPNRRFEQRRSPSLLVVGGLLFAAFVVSLVLWATLGDDGTKTPYSAPSTSVPGQTAAANAPVALSATLFDPDGDGTEKSTDIPKAFDNNPDTSWATLCYGDRWLGGKEGVGLTVDLGSTATGTLRILISSAPYQVQVFAAPDGPRPDRVAGYGSPVKKLAGTQPGFQDIKITSPSRYALIIFNEVGRDNSCQQNPYRGRIGEVSWVAD